MGQDERNKAPRDISLAVEFELTGDFLPTYRLLMTDGEKRWELARLYPEAVQDFLALDDAQVPPWLLTGLLELRKVMDAKKQVDPDQLTRSLRQIGELPEAQA